jgi:hypothetical protein
MEDSLQIKNTQGDIEFVSVDPQAQLVKTTKNQVAIKFNDIAIGDFIIAMGSVNAIPTSPENQNQGVLLAKRILVPNPLEDPEKFILEELQSIQKRFLQSS